jgi:hypothetical protein
MTCHQNPGPGYNTHDDAPVQCFLSSRFISGMNEHQGIQNCKIIGRQVYLKLEYTFKSSFFRAVMQGISVGVRSYLLLGLVFYPDSGGDMFL